MSIAIIVSEAAVIAFALSIDAFVASFSYGSNRIKMPFLSVQIINLVCGVILGLSLFAGHFFQQYIPASLTTMLSFGILFVLGIIKILDSTIKSLIRKYTGLKKEIRFSMLSLKFIFSIYADPEQADADCSKRISPVEAVSLAVALSLDGAAVGFGAALGNANVLAVFLCSLVTDTAALMLGSYVGNKLAGKLPFNVSWLSGFLLIVLALFRLY